MEERHTFGTADGLALNRSRYAAIKRRPRSISEFEIIGLVPFFLQRFNLPPFVPAGPTMGLLLMLELTPALDFPLPASDDDRT